MTNANAGSRHRRTVRTPQEMLDQDRAFERRLLWKGLLSLLIITLVIVVRQRYLL